jgi:hypothetical protein
MHVERQRDANAIHRDTKSEIIDITEKTVPVASDIIIIEDSNDTYSKKRVQISNLLNIGFTGYEHVTAYANLPGASDHSGEYYIVDTTTGIFLINQKKAGFYKSNGSNWIYIGTDPETSSLSDGATTVIGAPITLSGAGGLVITGNAIAGIVTFTSPSYSGVYEPANTNIQNHISDINNPHQTGILTLTNGNAGSIVICTPVYISSNNTVDKGKADNSGTKKIIGLVNQASIASGASGLIKIMGTFTATTGQWDAVAGTTGGLTANTKYYLSAGTAGLLTATPPSVVGQYVIAVGTAISTTELNINIELSILL